MGKITSISGSYPREEEARAASILLWRRLRRREVEVSDFVRISNRSLIYCFVRRIMMLFCMFFLGDGQKRDEGRKINENECTVSSSPSSATSIIFARPTGIKASHLLSFICRSTCSYFFFLKQKKNK